MRQVKAYGRRIPKAPTTVAFNLKCICILITREIEMAKSAASVMISIAQITCHLTNYITVSC